jgi:hypothetical protein
LDLFELAVGDDVTFTPALARQRAETLGLTLTVSPGGSGRWRAISLPTTRRIARGGWRGTGSSVDVCAALGAVAYTGALYGHPGVVKRRIPPAERI